MDHLGVILKGILTKPADQILAELKEHRSELTPENLSALLAIAASRGVSEEGKEIYPVLSYLLDEKAPINLDTLELLSLLSLKDEALLEKFTATTSFANKQYYLIRRLMEDEYREPLRYLLEKGKLEADEESVIAAANSGKVGALDELLQSIKKKRPDDYLASAGVALIAATNASPKEVEEETIEKIWDLIIPEIGLEAAREQWMKMTDERTSSLLKERWPRFEKRERKKGSSHPERGSINPPHGGGSGNPDRKEQQVFTL